MIRGTNTRARPHRRGTSVRRAELSVREYIKSTGAVHQGERLIVAVSGGADSSTLLLILDQLSAEMALSLTVAHFNHRLRSREEHDQDREYVTRLAERLGLPFVYAGGDVRARARRRGESVEDAARRMRYAFLGREARARGASAVVTGHTMDDQAETVLLHIARGAGINGLAGMRPRAEWPFGSGPAIARPLLALRREDTERYCRESRIEPRQDDTNLMLTATRNRIRLRVLPELEAINPRVVEALARLADAANKDTEFLAHRAQACFDKIALVGPGWVELTRDGLRALSPAMAARVLRNAVAHVTGSPADFEETHIQAVLDLAAGAPGRLSLPHGVSVESDSQMLRFSRGEGVRQQPISDSRLAVPGVTDVGDWRIRCRVIEKPASLVPATPSEAFLDLDSVGNSLTVRPRQPGDSLRPFGLGGAKKLQDIFVDAKVPARQRDGIPLVCTDWGIAWVAGHCLDERAAVKPSSERVLHIKVSPLKKRRAAW